MLTFILNNHNDPVQLVAVTKHGQVIGKQLVKINQLSQITDNVPTPQPHNNVTTNSTSNVVPNNKQATTPVANYQNKSTTVTTNSNVNKQPVNNSTNNQQYTPQGHYPMWKQGNVYYAKLPDGTVMSETFADGSDPGTYEGDPEVQRETDQMQDQWCKEHNLNN